MIFIIIYIYICIYKNRLIYRIIYSISDASIQFGGSFQFGESTAVRAASAAARSASACGLVN